MRFNPYEYQKYAIDFIVKNEIASVLLDMGLGKTVITLSAIKKLKELGLVKKVLIIAPLRVAKTTWPNEINKWEHLKCLTYSVAVGTLKERLKALDSDVDIHIINVENTEWLVNRSGQRFDYDMLVIDELSKFKSYSAKRFKSLLRVRGRFNRIVGLSGTPCSNGLLDLWAEYRLLDYGERLGRYITRYRDEYFIPDKRNARVIFSYKLKPFAEEMIYDKISDITISMKATDYLKMPKLIESEVEVELDEKDKAIYQALKKDMIVEISDDEIDAVNSAALVNKLLQMSNGAVYDEAKNVIHIHDKKLDALVDLIEEANGKPVLVAYWFKHDLARIKARFNAKEILTEDDINNWNKGLIPIGLIHPASCSMGLNLQDGGSTLIWFGLTWSLENYLQTNARLYRQGQKHSVVITHIITKGTIDEDVMNALRNKNVTQEALIDAVRAEVRR